MPPGITVTEFQRVLSHQWGELFGELQSYSPNVCLRISLTTAGSTDTGSPGVRVSSDTEAGMLGVTNDS